MRVTPESLHDVHLVLPDQCCVREFQRGANQLAVSAVLFSATVRFVPLSTTELAACPAAPNKTLEVISIRFAHSETSAFVLYRTAKLGGAFNLVTPYVPAVVRISAE